MLENKLKMESEIMFNNTQKIETNINKNTLGTTGLISVLEIMKYCRMYNLNGKRKMYHNCDAKNLVKNLQDQNVKIIKTFEDEKKWLVNLEDLNTCNSN